MEMRLRELERAVYGRVAVELVGVLVAERWQLGNAVG